MLNIWLFYSTLSQMRYVSLAREVYPLEEVIKCIISIAVENYKDEKEFFVSQTSGREFWRVEEMGVFFKLCEVEFDVEELREVVVGWTKDPKKTYLSVKDIKTILYRNNK